jgi:hypothetical protein
MVHLMTAFKMFRMMTIITIMIINISLSSIIIMILDD